MGQIIGDIVGAQQGAQQSMTGYNYLAGNIGSYVKNGRGANNMESQLLGESPMTAGTQNGFQAYLNSTGYNFMLNQGQNAITGSAAAKGILNSGSTAKALTSYGTNLGHQYFNNYLDQLSGLAGQGLTASGQIGQAGTQGGINAGDLLASGYAGAGGALDSSFANIFGMI